MPSSAGDGLIAKAEKKAAGSSGWFGSGNKWEEAGDLFQQAANAYKLEQKWRESGHAFEKEADCRVKGNEMNDAMNAYHNAAKSYKKSDPEAAVSCLHQCINLLTKAGSFRQAADREKEIGAIYQQDNLNLAKARDSYVRAAEWYKQEDANATANQCFVTSAELSAELEDFPKAIELFERVADASLGNPLTKYSVKEYWLKAALCSMAMGDLVSTNRILTSAAQKDVTYPSTREYKFCAQLMDACEQGDVEAFTGAIFEYDSVQRLDNFKTKLLLIVKRALENEANGVL